MPSTHISTWAIILLFAGLFSQSWAVKLAVNPKSDIVGIIKTHQVKAGDDWYKISQHYDVGFDELKAANNRVNVNYLMPGTLLLMPTMYILPKPSWRKGILIDLSSRRLFYFSNKDKRHVWTFPVGIGRAGWMTPTGKLTILDKRYKPTWYIPKSVKKAFDEDGINLPNTIKAGRNNPLGRHAMRLSKSGYLIHGTNNNTRIGRRSTSGCVSMYPDDIKVLYRLAPSKTPVRIINQAIAVGVDEAGQVWFDAHGYVSDKKLSAKQKKPWALKHSKVIHAALRRALKQHSAVIADWSLLTESIANLVGLPLVIGHVKTL
jgi:L,D-transpeptidase ErfK/SrfK